MREFFRAARGFADGLRGLDEVMKKHTKSYRKRLFAATAIVLAGIGCARGPWRTRHRAEFTVHAPRASISDDSLSALADKVVRASADVHKRLEVIEHIDADIYFVASREELTRLTGQRGGGRTDVATGKIFMVNNAKVHPAVHHELGHLLSWRIWGQPVLEWVNEGVAVDAVRGCDGKSLHEWASAFDQENRLIPLQDLEHRFSFADINAVLEGGSVVQYVREQYGMNALLRLWHHGLAEFARSVGRTEPQIEQEWLAVVRAHSPSPELRNRHGPINCE